MSYMEIVVKQSITTSCGLVIRGANPLDLPKLSSLDLVERFFYLTHRL